MGFLDKVSGLLDGPQKEDEVLPEHASVFQDYDIRGHYPTEIDEHVFFNLGRAISRAIRPQSITIGRDSRLSSLPLAKALSAGFLYEGVNVTDIGLCTTPEVSWVSRTKKWHACMVTASHNHPPDNGIKLYHRTLGSIHAGTGMKDVEEEYRVLKDDPLPEERVREELLKKVEHKDVTPAYQKFLQKYTKGLSGMRLAVDYSNGTVGVVLNDVLSAAGVLYDTLHEKPNGLFPGHSPNPLLPESHASMAGLLQRGRYDLGVVFDADGDRVVFFDEKGEVLSSELIEALLVEHHLKYESGSRGVVVTASFSKIVRDVVESCRGKLYISPVGRTNVAPLMKKYRAFFGVERSGHYFFQEFSYEDGGIFALLKVMSTIAQTGTPLSQLIAPYRRYVTIPEINIAREAGSEEAVFRTLRRHFKGRSSAVDGLTIEFKTWWFNLRSSRTENVWRLTIEGTDRDTVERKRKEVETIIRNIKDLTE